MKHLTEKLTARFEVMTKERVERYLSMNTHNRRPSEEVIAAYARDMVEGSWLPTNQGIGISESGVLLDGQQRLLAIQRAKAYGIVMLVVTGLDDAVQAVVDNGKKRSAADAFVLLGNPDARNLHVAVTRIIHRDRNGLWGRTNLITIPELYTTFKCIFEDTSTVVTTLKGYSKLNASTTAAFVEAINKAYPQNADQILDLAIRVVSGEMLAPKSAALALHRHIQASKSGGSGGALVQRERFFKALNAIKAHIDGRDLDKLYATDPREKK